MEEHKFAGRSATDGQNHRPIDFEEAMEFLHTAEISIEGLLPWSTNYTFLTTLEHGQTRAFGVYKPQGGERPLWDFPRGTLCLREYASFLVSQALGWRLIPPTALREGPLGFGMLQLFIDSDPEEHYFVLRTDYPHRFRQLATFDIITNNADRKAGHVLRDSAGQIWAIDHGLTFHAEQKLRTVIWDFAGEAIPPGIHHDLASLLKQTQAESSLFAALSPLLSSRELDAFHRRLRDLLRRGRFTSPSSHSQAPWPLI